MHTRNSNDRTNRNVQDTGLIQKNTPLALFFQLLNSLLAIVISRRLVTKSKQLDLLPVGNRAQRTIAQLELLEHSCIVCTVSLHRDRTINTIDAEWRQYKINNNNSDGTAASQLLPLQSTAFDYIVLLCFTFLFACLPTFPYWKSKRQLVMIGTAFYSCHATNNTQCEDLTLHIGWF